MKWQVQQLLLAAAVGVKDIRETPPEETPKGKTGIQTVKLPLLTEFSLCRGNFLLTSVAK